LVDRESASLTTWTTILDDTEAIAQIRYKFADQLNVNAVDHIRALEARCEGLRKRVVLKIFSSNPLAFGIYGQAYR
jgi:hypothetical protein